MRFADYHDAKRYLYSLKHHGAKYGIERMQLLAAAMGHPERAYPVIHVAGTNGKGSTCAMLDAIYRAAGYKTGLFTSPHLVHAGERIQVDRQPLDPDGMLTHVEALVPLAEELAAKDPDDHPSFFEFMTGIAFRQFAHAKVDLGIIETGLGGRLDATNIVQPELSIITSISLDHTEILGDTLTKVAYEKAGIIKPGKPVVIGHLPPEAEAEIRRIAADRGSPVHSVRDAFGDNVADCPHTALPGDFQRRNAACAVLAVRLLGDRFPVGDDAIAQGLAGVTWPGRWDTYRFDQRTVILDATHNAEGARELDRNLRRLVEEEGVRPHIVTGTLGENRAAALMPVVARWARTITLLSPHQPRACPTSVLRAALPSDTAAPVRTSKVRRVFPAAGVCALGEPGDTIVVTGSIYLLGEILEAMHYAEPVNDAMLQ